MLWHTVSRMECKGLVRRGTCGEDKRGVVAELTDEGFTLLERAARDHVTTVREYFIDVVDPADLDAIGRAFATVSERARRAR